MAYELRLPDLGEGLSSGEVVRWLVQEGQEVAEDEPLVEIQTDKATVEIPAPAPGTVARILVPEGQVVPVGTPLVVIAGEPGDTRPALVGAGPGPRATPRVRRLAQELGVDLAALVGSGGEGQVTEEDVRRAAGSTLLPGLGGREGRREPLRGLRRAMAERMAEAHRHAVPVTWVEECDFEGIDLRRVVASVVRACALSLREYPELNARLEDDELVYLDRYDIGVAVHTDRGLVVPVVRGCDALGVEEIDAEIRRLAEAAWTGSLAPSEARGSTFTVTSAGKLAGLFQTPVVNYPEVAILSIGRIAPRPVVRGDEVVVRRTGLVALTFDHRVVEGTRAALFGLSVIGRLQRPDEL